MLTFLLVILGPHRRSIDSFYTNLGSSKKQRAAEEFVDHCAKEEASHALSFEEIIAKGTGESGPEHSRSIEPNCLPATITSALGTGITASELFGCGSAVRALGVAAMREEAELLHAARGDSGTTGHWIEPAPTQSVQPAPG